MIAIGSRITGTGSFLPETRLTNQMLEQMVDTSDEWIVQRTGIRERRVAVDMQAIDGVTGPTVTHSIIRKTVLVDGLVKLSYASTWDSLNQRPDRKSVV